MVKCEFCSKWRCICNRPSQKKLTLEERLVLQDSMNSKISQKNECGDDVVFHGYSKNNERKKYNFTNFNELYKYTPEELRNVRVIRSQELNLLHIASMFFGPEEIDFCINEIGIDIESRAKPGTALLQASYKGPEKNIRHLRMLGAEESPEVEEKLQLWEEFGHILENIEDAWVPKGETPIRFGNRFQVKGRYATVYRNDRKVITLPFGIFKRENGVVGFSWKGHAWRISTIENATEELVSEFGQRSGGLVWRRA